MKKSEETIKIAMVMGKMENGGVESVIMNYYRNIDRSLVQFDFFVDNDSSLPQREEIERLGGRIYMVPPYQRLFPYIRALVSKFRENRYKIVHSNINTLSVFPLFAARIAGIPIRIIHNHSTAGKGETKKNILKYILRPFAKINATNYFACSEFAAEWIFGKRFLENGKVKILKNAISLDKFKYNEELRSQIRRELGVNDKFVIGHVGRFCYQKNHDFLLDIFKAIHDTNANAVLMLIGEGELEEDIKSKADSLGLSNCVKFLGVRNDTYKLYQAMDVFILPSRYEGLPVVGVEAQASGLPCLFSDAMTRETHMLESSVMLNLSESAQKWAKITLDYKGFMRNDTSEQLRKQGYDISVQGVQLTELYYEILNSEAHR